MDKESYIAYRRMRKLKRIARQLKDDPEKAENRKKVRRAIRKIKEKFGFEW